MRLTKQGVRDLNPPGHSNPSRTRRVYRCPHIWGYIDREYDCWTATVILVERCGLCHAVRRCTVRVG